MAWKGFFARPSREIIETVAPEFDRDFYLKAYPDVESAGVDPLRHFLIHGWREGRKPRQDFDTRFYLWLYPDVAAWGGNPLYHYIRYGRHEARITLSELLTDVASKDAWNTFLQTNVSIEPKAEGIKSDRTRSFVIRYENVPAHEQILLSDREIDATLAEIEKQLPLFERDTQRLNADTDSPHVKEAERTRDRQRFDFALREKAMKTRPPRFSNWPGMNLQTHPRATARLDQTIGTWISENLKPEAMLVVAGMRVADRLLKALADAGISGPNVTQLLAGEGEVQGTKIFHPNRYRPGAGSLGHWLSATADAERQQILAYVLGEDATELDLELLSGALLPNQFVLISVLSKLRSAVQQKWSGTVTETGDSILICLPGPRELDPITIDSETLSKINWPRISVVTVSYNQGQFLEACLNSVLGQKYPNLEYIVIDACSTDGSVDILESYRSKISKLVIEPDEGQSEGLNKGFGFATGDILTWVNSDDMLAPGALRRAARAFMIHTTDLVAGGCERIGVADDEVQYLHHSALPLGRKVPLGAVEQLRWYNSWDLGDYFFQPEVLFTADIWRRAGGRLKRHLYWGMDWELWIRMAFAGATIVHIPATLGRSREHPLQKTTSERLYLYQLKNILLEHHDELAAIKTACDGRASFRRPSTWFKLAG